MSYKDYLWEQFLNDNSDIPDDEQTDAFDEWIKERTVDEFSEMATLWALTIK
jgi:hypothetical protein